MDTTETSGPAAPSTTPAPSTTSAPASTHPGTAAAVTATLPSRAPTTARRRRDSAGEPVVAIDVHDVHKTFGATRAVDGMTLRVPTSQIVALLGQNGAGKTTLIDMVLGLQPPDSGTTSLFGLSPRDAIRRSLVGVVHQTGALLPEYTVAQTLRVFAGTHQHHLPVDDVLDQTDLTGLARRRVGKLSGGEQQRVRLALALLPDPLLLVLDEPTAGMDAVARRHFWQLMRAQADAGRTIVFATHYLTEAQDFAERTVIVKAGRIITDAPTAEVRRLDTSRSLRIALDIDEGARLALERALRGLPGGGGWLIEWPRGEVTIQGPDLDPAARLLLDTPGASGLEIVPSSLEDVFAELTA